MSCSILGCVLFLNTVLPCHTQEEARDTGKDIHGPNHPSNTVLRPRWSSPTDVCHTAVCLEFSFSFIGDEGLFRVNWLKLAALHLALGAPPPSPTKAWVWPEGRVLERSGTVKPWACWSKWFPACKGFSLEKRLWMSWNFSFSSCKKTSTRSFFSRLSCSTMFLGTSGITQATTRLRNITRFWRNDVWKQDVWEKWNVDEMSCLIYELNVICLGHLVKWLILMRLHLDPLN